MPSPSPTAGQAREHNNENASYTLNETGPLLLRKITHQQSLRARGLVQRFTYILITFPTALDTTRLLEHIKRGIDTGQTILLHFLTELLHSSADFIDFFHYQAKGSLCFKMLHSRQ